MSKEISTRLAEHRRLKGWTQEELADKSGVTARTIQRIESGSVNPQAYTLKLLAASLGVDFKESAAPQPPGRLPQPTTEPPHQRVIIQKPAESRWLTLMHLLPLSAAILPGSNILFPLIFWVIKKDEYEEYDMHGRAVLNFQLTMALIFIPTIILMVFYFPIGFPLFILLGIYTLTMPVLNAIWVTTGKKIRYPLSIPFFKRYPARNS